MVLWSNASCMRSGGRRFCSCFFLFDTLRSFELIMPWVKTVKNGEVVSYIKRLWRVLLKKFKGGVQVWFL